jgi:hypothetical protein
MFLILSDDVRFNDFLKVEISIFLKFALYADHARLSPLGNRLMAEELFKSTERKWQGKI